MNVLSKLTLRNLKLNRKRTIVTLIGIILSGAMICGVATLIFSFQQGFIDHAKVTDGAHYATFYNVPGEKSEFIEDHAYTKTAMYKQDVGYAQWDKIDNKQKKYLYVQATDAEGFAHFPIHLTEGRFPENENEIIISKNLLTTGGHEYTIGELITVGIGQPIVTELEDGEQSETFELIETKQYTITGWIEAPRNEYYNTPYVAYTFFNKEMLGASDLVDISIIGTNVKRIYDMAPQIAEAAGASQLSYNNELLKWMGMTQNDYIKEMMYSVGLIIILLIVIGSVTVIYNAFAISVSERKKQFGMLSSVGTTQRQIRKMVFMEGFVLALIGIPIGILSGIAGIGVTLEVINSIMSDSLFSSNMSLPLVISWKTVLISIVFITLTIFLSAFIPAKRAAKITPIEAIRLNTDIQIKGKKLKTSKLTKLLFGIEGELALKNLKRNRKRYRATVFSLFISIVLYISFSSFMTYSMKSGEMYYEQMEQDFTIIKQNVETEEKLHLYEQIAHLPEVDDFSIQRLLWQKTKVDEEQIGSFLQAFIDPNDSENERILLEKEDDQYIFYVDLIALGEEHFERYAKQLGLDPSEYMDPADPRGILVNRNRIEHPVVSEYKPLDIDAGEKLELTEFYEVEDPYQLALEIGAITEELPFAVRYTGIYSLNMIVSDSVFDHFASNQRNEDFFINPELHLRVVEGTDRENFTEQIVQIDTSLQSGSPVNIYDHELSIEEMKRSTLVISIFLYGFIGLITLIGVTNIFNTISTNVALRRREFAMLKSVGLTPSGFNKMMNYESVFYGLKALLYGLPVGILISVWMYNSVTSAFRFAFVLPWKEIAVCVVAVFVIVFLTMMFSSAKLKKENIIDALKEENL